MKTIKAQILVGFKSVAYRTKNCVKLTIDIFICFSKIGLCMVDSGLLWSLYQRMALGSNTLF